MMLKMIIVRRNRVGIADFSRPSVGEIEIGIENGVAEFRQTIIIGMVGWRVAAHTSR